jgi:hypothetical protein
VRRQRGHLVVAKLVNGHRIRRTTSIPAAALAVKRFEVAVLAAAGSWLEGGYLADDTVACVVDPMPPDLRDRIAASARDFEFEDPWSGSGHVSLVPAVVAVDIAGFANVSDLLVEAGRRLNAECEARAEPGDDKPVRPREWCSEV